MKKQNIKRSRALAGYAFISPFLIGLFLIFSYALIMAVMFSLSEINIGEKGYTLTFAGIKYFKDAFLVHPTFNRSLVSSIEKILLEVPLVIMFSFFMAVLLNQKFKGRSLVRVLFFMPVILSTGILQKMDNFNQLQGGLSGAAVETTFSQFSGIFDLGSLLLSLDIAPDIVLYITGGVESIYKIINLSGIQMLVFLMALQSISPSLYEASAIEGATAWENMWKITFPMVSPYILTCVVYTIIDSFTSYENPVMDEILAVSTGSALNYSYMTAMAMIYFVIIAAVLALVTFLLSKLVFYQN